MDACRAWIILNMLPDIGRGKFHALLDHFGEPQAVLDASEEALRQVPGIGAMAVRSIRNWHEHVDPDRELKLVEAHGVRLLCLHDADYPANLKCSPQPPPLLYVRGSIEAIDQAAVAVIGARKMSRYGRDHIEAIVPELAAAGVSIVSGLALGIDGAAHQAALDAGGRTLAVLGNGLASIYPANHRQLAEAVIESGALVSEMPMEARPDAGSFPQRNAIIAGLSLGVLVIEAGRQSGTLITAGQALEANRLVFAIPGDIDRVNSIGTNRLIREGAILVTCAQDLLSDLREPLSEILQELPESDEHEAFQDARDANPAKRRPETPLSDEERLVYEALALDPLFIDELGEALLPQGIGQSELMATLLRLEVKGVIRQEPGKRFRRLR